MNAFARGNVANAQRTIARACRTLARLEQSQSQNDNDIDAMELRWLREDLATSLEDLERAVTLDDMTEAAQ